MRLTRPIKLRDNYTKCILRALNPLLRKANIVCKALFKKGLSST